MYKRQDGRVVLQGGEEGRLVGNELGRKEYLFGFGRGVAYESRERNFRVDDDVFLLGPVSYTHLPTPANK